MSKLSEEEIIDIIKDFLELREIHSSDDTRKSYLSIYQEAIQGLLDLYQKEIKIFKWKENEQKNLLKYKTDRIDKQQKEIEELKKELEKERN